MKKTTMLICAAAFAALPVFAETIVFSTPKDFRAGQVKQNADSLQIVKRSWTIGTKRIKFDATAKYKVTVDIKANADDLPKLGKHKVRFGLMPLSDDYKVLSPVNLFVIDGTDTLLAAPVKKGDTVVKVKDAFKWRITNSTYIVFDCDPTGKLRDLPNFNVLGNIAKVNRATGEITLAAPAKVTLDVDTAVRQHQNSWSVIGNEICEVSGEWQTFTFTTVPGESTGTRDNPRYKVWKGTAYLEPVVTTMIPLEIRNLKVEVIK